MVFVCSGTSVVLFDTLGISRCHKTQGKNESANLRFLQRLSVIFGFHRDCPWPPASCRDYRPRKMASCRDCPCDSASCRDSRQEAKSHGQSLQEAIISKHNRSSRKQEIADSLGGSQIWRTVSAGSVNWRTRLYPVQNISIESSSLVHHRSYQEFVW